MYYIYYEDGVKQEKYCGPASDPNSKENVIKFQIEDLQKQKRIISAKISELSSKLSR